MPQIRLARISGITAVLSLAIISGCHRGMRSGNETDAGIETSSEIETDNDTASWNDSATESSSETGSTVEGDYYQIEYDPNLRNPYLGDQGMFNTYTITTCTNERFDVIKDTSPFIWLIVFFHDEYELVGSHPPRFKDPEGQYSAGFLAGYSDHAYDEGGGWDQYIQAETGTVTISLEDDEVYKVVYNIVFVDEIRKIGEMTVEPCDSPVYDW
jgi:hypothetical protein